MRVLPVYDTFSNTAGSFGHLCTHSAGQPIFLNAAFEGHNGCWTSTTRTPGESVEAKAELMADARLEKWAAILPPQSVLFEICV